MNNNPEIQNNDEISLLDLLLDLFTVLIRYRKLIIAITLCVIALAVAGYFIYPVYQYNNALENRLVEGRMLMSIKQNIRQFVTQHPESFINRADVVMDSLREAGMDEFEYARNQTISLTDEAERTRALYLIDQILIKNMSLNGKAYKEMNRKFQVNTYIQGNVTNITTGVRDNFTIEAVFKYKDPELVRSFLQRLVVRGNVIARDLIRVNIEAIVNNYEDIMDSPYAEGFSWQNAIGGNLFTYAYAKDLIDGKETVLAAVGEPIITESPIFLASFRDSYKLKGVILVFAGIFLAVLLAFVLNTIHSIRNDEQVMKKINDAMGKTDSQ